jgi:hypothetical protein
MTKGAASHTFEVFSHIVQGPRTSSSSVPKFFRPRALYRFRWARPAIHLRKSQDRP